MSVTIVHDLPPEELEFHWKSGRLCLDFVATVGERWRRSFERLIAPQDLGRWMGETGTLDAPPKVSPSELAAGRTLREAIDRLARPGTEPAPGECGAPDCALLFVDTSRPGRRRWCSTAACGNRIRTRAYRQRRKDAG